ncbi:unnamed protein product [Rotaria magnacalcarata]|nr:unnamed protein product [Rotaria magnacalcarata]CAF2267683.1 unnamed protein product [Rotaria magnacalcarata]
MLILVLFSHRHRIRALKQSEYCRVISAAVSSNWVTQFQQHEYRIFSQNGEDGILLWIFANIGTLHQPPRFVEFGVQNGKQCNTRFLREHLGWQGLMMDVNNVNLTINLRREMISPKNINDLLAKYDTPSTIDLLSIDIDFDDYFVWKSILQANRFHARVVVIEFNYEIPPNENRVVNPNQDSRRWTRTNFFGAGILALAALGRVHGYTLVYGDKNAVNLFFVQTCLLLHQGVFYDVPSVEQLHVSKPARKWKHAPETDKSRTWIWNDTAWIP